MILSLKWYWKRLSHLTYYARIQEFQLILQFYNGLFQRKLYFSQVSEWVQHFPGGVQHFPGGGGPTFSRGGGDRTPYPRLWIRTCILTLNYLYIHIHGHQSNSYQYCVIKKRDMFPMNEMELQFSKIFIFSSNQCKILEIRKCYSMALMSTFDISKIKCPDM